jgi:rubredoxin
MWLKCFSCGAIFNLGEADIDHERLPNTINRTLPDHNAPKLNCPKCGVWETPEEKFEDFETNAEISDRR